METALRHTGRRCLCRQLRGAGHARLAAEAPARDRTERSRVRPAPEHAERSSCMTSAQVASRAGSARSRPSATTGTARRTGCRSCTGSSALRSAARLPWRSSPAMRPITRGEGRGLEACDGQGDTKRNPPGRAGGPQLLHAARRPLGRGAEPAAPAGPWQDPAERRHRAHRDQDRAFDLLGVKLDQSVPIRMTGGSRSGKTLKNSRLVAESRFRLP